jgi:hypothetical protein
MRHVPYDKAPRVIQENCTVYEAQAAFISCTNPQSELSGSLIIFHTSKLAGLSFHTCSDLHSKLPDCKQQVTSAISLQVCR